MTYFNNETPIAMLTVGQLKDILNSIQGSENTLIQEKDKKYVYGIAGIANLFNCSIPTANRIKQSGKIDKAISQIGRKIIVDTDLAIELAGQRKGGRKK